MFWPEFFRSLAIEFGYTVAEIKAMTFDDVRLLSASSAYMPSQRMLVAALAKALGIEMPAMPVSSPSLSATPESKYTTGEELARLVAVTGGGANLGMFAG